MEVITTDKYAIHFNENCYIELNKYLKENHFSKLFILVDENTHQFCLPSFLSRVETTIELEIIEIESGEIHKSIETCDGVWNALSELGADRKSLLINVGGGVLTDLGGFVASTFKRGINFINIPTTLLAMVDASVGGKTGIDLGSLKNQIGVFSYSDMVLVDTSFLKTLPYEELRSGFAEMLKHGLIHDEAYWKTLIDINDLATHSLDNLIYDSIKIKHNVVTIDPKETGLRKTLNFGHTIGHAIESYCLSNTNIKTLLHGEAIAIGMILAGYISSEVCAFPLEKLQSIKHNFLKYYDKVLFSNDAIEEIINLLKFDKKNTFGKINFVLLRDIGLAKTDCNVPNDLIRASFKYYAT